MLFGMSHEVRYDSRVLGQIGQAVSIPIFSDVVFGVDYAVATEAGEQCVLYPVTVEWDQGRRQRAPWT